MSASALGLMLFFISAVAPAAIRQTRAILSKTKNVTKSSISPVAATVTTSSNSACEGCGVEGAVQKSNGMLDSVKQYDRHVLLCGSATEWPKKIESITDFPMSMISRIEAAADIAAVKIKITACHHVSSYMSQQSCNGNTARLNEVIVYPDNLLFVVSESQAESFAQLLAERRSLNMLPAERLQQFRVQSTPFQKLVLVCTHGNRDKRCGRAGPQVIEALQKELATLGIADTQIAVRGTSHIGGHKFAGTLIVYPESQWYGRITKSNTKQLLNHILDGRVMQECSRGQNLSSINDW